MVEVMHHQATYGVTIAKQYLKHKNLSDIDAHYVFEEGDHFLLKAKQPHKLVPWALGPYRFVRYMGTSHLGVEICAAEGGGKPVSVTMLHTCSPCFQSSQAIYCDTLQTNTATIWAGQGGRT